MIDGQTNKVTATVSAGETPVGVAVDQNIGKIFAVNANSDSVSLINVGTNKVSATIGVGSQPA